MKAEIAFIAIFVASLKISYIDGAIVSCYYPSWGIYMKSPWTYGINHVPSDSCDVLIYAFVGIDSKKWGIKILDPSADVDLGGFKNAVGLKKRSLKTKVLVSLGGAGQSVKVFSDLVHSKSNRQKFIKSAVSFIAKYKFDGLDLDWEYPGADGGRKSDKADFALFAKELSAEFKKRKWMLTAAVINDKSAIEAGYDIPELSKYLDRIHVMTYDMRGFAWTNNADNPSPLYRRSFDKGYLRNLNVKDTMALYVSLGAPKKKLFLGIPFYGGSYTLKNPKSHVPNSPAKAAGKPGKYSDSAGTLSYFEICTAIRNDNWKTGFDEVGKVPYAYRGDQWVGFDNAKSIAIKMKFIKDQGYGGAMVWSLGQDDFLGKCGAKNVLLNAVNNS